MITWEIIKKANADIKPLEITRNQKTKDGGWETITNQYCEVKERIIAFRKVCPGGQILTEYTFTENYVYFKATITDGERILSTGNARELASKNYAFENAETSAVGRALGFMGIGVSVAIASAEDMMNTEDNVIFDMLEDNKNNLIKQFKQLYSNEDRVKILNNHHVLSEDKLSVTDLKGYIDGKSHSRR